MNDRSMRACTEPKSKRGHVARLVSRYSLLALKMRQQTQRVERNVQIVGRNSTQDPVIEIEIQKDDSKIDETKNASRLDEIN